MIIVQQKHNKRKLKQDFLNTFKNTKKMDKNMYLNQSIEVAKCNKKW